MGVRDEQSRARNRKMPTVSLDKFVLRNKTNQAVERSAVQPMDVKPLSPVQLEEACLCLNRCVNYGWQILPALLMHHVDLVVLPDLISFAETGAKGGNRS